MEILINTGLAILGILLFTLVLAQNHIKAGSFDWQRFVSDNAYQWIWSVFTAIVVIVVLAIVPDFKEPIKGIIGLDVDASAGSYFLLGFGLSSIIRPSTK